MTKKNEAAEGATNFWLITLTALSAITTLVVTIATVSGQSLSIDEQITHLIANKQGLLPWANDLVALRTSDIQKPSYHLYQYIWSRSFGLSEYSMRLANAPWLLLAGVITAVSFRRIPLLATCLVFATACHPLLWFYMNDAQPYAMMWASMMLCCAGLYGFYIANQGQLPSVEGRWNLVVLLVGMFLLSSANMLGVLWSGVLALLMIWVWWSGTCRYRFDKVDAAIVSVFLVAMVALGSLYLFSLMRGASATRLHESNILTVAFSAYEILGLGGLGPGRDDIRVDGLVAFTGHWPRIIAGGTIILAFLGYAAWRLAIRLGVRKTLLLAVALLLPTLATLGVGYALHWRVLGRHILPAAVVLSYLAAFGLYSLLSRKNAYTRLAAIAFIASTLTSAVGYTTLRHAKEDFAKAAEVAAEFVRDGHRVWWVANAASATHYGLPVSLKEREYQCADPIAPSTALVVRNLSSECIATLAVPELILYSRPDANDQFGTITEVIAGHAYALHQSMPGFRIWRLKPEYATP